MLKEIAHVGVTVKDIDKSIKFYSEVLGLKFTGKLTMEGKETDRLFKMENIKVNVAYLNGSEKINCPPVELISFEGKNIKDSKSELDKTSISEICFVVENIDEFYNHLIKNKVECLSAPQNFDFTEFGFSKSKAIYFKDIDGIILEAMEYIK